MPSILYPLLYTVFLEKDIDKGGFIMKPPLFYSRVISSANELAVLLLREAI